MQTKNKILIGGIISKIICFFLSKKQFVKRNGISWQLDLTEGIDLSIFLFGSSEKKIVTLRKIFNSDKKLIFLDIGANIGSVSLPLAKLFNNALIYSIEPTNYAFNKLYKNLSINKNLKKQILINQLFVSDKKDPKKVWSSWNFNKNKNKHHKHKGNLKSIKANSRVSLDDFIKINEIKRVDFIKLDVDGYEMDFFKSGKKFFKKNKPVIFIELAPYLYPEFGYSCFDLIKFIKKIGYNFFDENLKKVTDIEKTINSIDDGSSRNFFLAKEHMVQV